MPKRGTDHQHFTAGFLVAQCLHDVADLAELEPALLMVLAKVGNIGAVDDSFKRPMLI